MQSPEEYVDFLILNGAVEVVGVSTETGEFLYKFTDKLAEIAPQIYEGMMDEFEKDIMHLWVEGFLSMDPTGPNPVVSLLPKAFDEDAVVRLTYDQQLTLNELKRIFFIEE